MSAEGTIPHQARSAARLAALQALYQLEMTGNAPDEVIEEFVQHRFGLDPETGEVTPHDEAFFSDVVHGVLKHQVADSDKEIQRHQIVVSLTLQTECLL